MNENVAIPMPRIESLVNENGDIIYRAPYTNRPVIIRKAEIEQYLDDRPLDNTNVWEVMQHFSQKKDTPSKPDQEPQDQPHGYQNI